MNILWKVGGCNFGASHQYHKQVTASKEDMSSTGWSFSSSTARTPKGKCSPRSTSWRSPCTWPFHMYSMTSWFKKIDQLWFIRSWESNPSLPLLLVGFSLGLTSLVRALVLEVNIVAVHLVAILVFPPADCEGRISWFKELGFLQHGWQLKDWTVSITVPAACKDQNASCNRPQHLQYISWFFLQRKKTHWNSWTWSSENKQMHQRWHYTIYFGLMQLHELYTGHATWTIPEYLPSPLY